MPDIQKVFYDTGLFKINYKKLVVWLVPQWARRGSMMLFLLSANSPLRQAYDAFQRFAIEKIYRLSHNSQTCYLRGVLNDKFDMMQRRIVIADFDGIERIYFWPEADQRDVDFTQPLFFYPDAMYVGSGVDFTIKVPYGINLNGSVFDYFKSLVNEYKLAGKNYNIVRF